MLEIVKLALRVTTTAYDSEIQLLIADCLLEIQALGVTNISTTDNTTGTVTYNSEIQTTVIAYCKWKFGDADNKSDWEGIYHTKLGQLKVSKDHTNW